MEFATVGIVHTDPPSEHIKPFMRRKLKTWFRSWDTCENGRAVRKDMLEVITKKSSSLPEEQRQNAIAAWMSKCDFVIFCDTKRDIYTEDEFIESWLQRIYAEPESRSKTMDRLKSIAGLLFRQMDRNKNGHVSFEEFQEGSKIYCPNIAKILFGAIDNDNDGIVSMHEFVYGLINHHMCSGPESPFSLWYGPVLEDQT